MAPGQIAVKILKPQICHLMLWKHWWAGKCFNSALVLRVRWRGFPDCANGLGVNTPNMAGAGYHGSVAADAATKSSAHLGPGSQ